MKYPQLVSMPSAVSDWLEEQLEARGIDSEVYTRYILSLLHAHTLDVIYPEEDFPFTQLKKDGGRGAAFPKRVRRAGAWWKYADADAEQIKRSAAVECLMSAAEQNCEIESLVDELCEKLKEVNSEAENSSNETIQDTKSNQEPPKQRKFSPKELAEKYYAAFPPLNQKEGNSYLASNITLVAGKWPTPEKNLNNIDLITAKWTSSGSPKKAKRKPKRSAYDTMKSTSRHGQNRNRFGYKRAHCVRALTREMADNRANWECVNNNNNNYMNEALLRYFVEDVDEEPEAPIRLETSEWMKDWMAEINKSCENTLENIRRQREIDQPQTVPVYSPTAIWSNDEYSRIWSNNGRTGLQRPLDNYPINEGGRPWWLPAKQESAIRDEYQRCGDEEESAIKEEYERRPFADTVTERIRERWAINRERRLLTRRQQQTSAWDLGLVTPENIRISEAMLDVRLEDEPDRLLEDISRWNSPPSVLSSVNDLPAEFWGDQSNINVQSNENQCLFDPQTISLMKINHNKDRSPFGEYVRPTVQNDTAFHLPGPYSRPFTRPFNRPSMPAKVVPTPPMPKGRWESSSALFRPIQTPPPQSEITEEPSRQYQDGATFAIRGNLDEVDFKRSTTGSLYLKTESGDVVKYRELEWQPPSDESLNLPRTVGPDNNDSFKLKFPVNQNDKACQTEDQCGLLAIVQNVKDVDNSTRSVRKKTAEEEAAEMKKRVARLLEPRPVKCQTCGLIKNLTSESLVAIWKDVNENCIYCNRKHQWSNFLKKLNIELDAETLKKVWEEDKTCRPVQKSMNETSPDGTNDQLRVEVDEDAERLLIDLNNVQQDFDNSAQPTVQPETQEAATDRKRRHSHMDGDTVMWSFATRLEEDCLNNSSTLPIRRSVTL